ncbi:MAG TPA: hypothetical protein VGR45_07305 [Stellaceae bacterium]|nr:hypothetical protein [Stellaceae bacterium]
MAVGGELDPSGGWWLQRPDRRRDLSASMMKHDNLDDRAGRPDVAAVGHDPDQSGRPISDRFGRRGTWKTPAL